MSCVCSFFCFPFFSFYIVVVVGGGVLCVHIGLAWVWWGVEVVDLVAILFILYRGVSIQWLFSVQRKHEY